MLVGKKCPPHFDAAKVRLFQKSHPTETFHKSPNIAQTNKLYKFTLFSPPNFIHLPPNSIH